MPHRSVLLFSSYLSSFPQARLGQKTDYRLYFLFIFHARPFQRRCSRRPRRAARALAADDIFTIHAARQKEGLPYRSGEIWIDALSCAASLPHDFRIKEKGIGRQIVPWKNVFLASCPDGFPDGKSCPFLHFADRFKILIPVELDDGEMGFLCNVCYGLCRFIHKDADRLDPWIQQADEARPLYRASPSSGFLQR